MTLHNPTIIYPYVSPQATALPVGAAYPAGAPTNLPSIPPAFEGGPYTKHYGLQLILPLQKQYTSGALRRVVDAAVFNNGATLTNSTAYPSWIAIPRNATVTGAWVICGVAPSAGTNTLQLLSGSSGGTTILTSASFNLTAMTPNVLVPLPLLAAGNALLDFYSASAAPPALYVAWNAGVQVTAAMNCALFVEFEMDDF